MISKKIKETVYNKYNGHCAYCGCEIEMKDMQVDHIVPKRRGYFQYGLEAGLDNIDNLNPSCRMCNYYKGMNILEVFRNKLKGTLMPNVQRPFIFRLAEKYGMVEVKEWDGKFYYEKIKNKQENK